MTAQSAVQPVISALITFCKGAADLYKYRKQKRAEKASRLRRSRQRRWLQQRSQHRMLS